VPVVVAGRSYAEDSEQPNNISLLPLLSTQITSQRESANPML